MTTSLRPFAGNGPNALAGRKIFIAGGGSGVGAVLARMAAACGAMVAIAGRSPAKLNAVAAELGDRLLAMYALDPEDADAIRRAVGEHGPYDHIVTNAKAGPWALPAETLRHRIVAYWNE